MRHKDKVKLARKLRTKEEQALRVPIFQTAAWDARRKAILKRLPKGKING